MLNQYCLLFYVLQFQEWRNDALTRLDALKQRKRYRMAASTYSSPSASSPVTKLSKVNRKPDSAYAPTPARTLSKNVQRTLDVQSASSPVATLPIVHGNPDHAYALTPTNTLCKNVRQTLDTKSAKTVLTKDIVPSFTDSGDLDSHVNTLLKHKKSRDIIIGKLLAEMDSNIDAISIHGSVLGKDAVGVKKLVSAAVEELQKQAPLLFRVLSTAAWSPNDDKNPAFYGIIYGMLMRRRNQRLNAIQKVVTAICLRYHAGNQVNYCYLL